QGGIENRRHCVHCRKSLIQVELCLCRGINRGVRGRHAPGSYRLNRIERIYFEPAVHDTITTANNRLVVQLVGGANPRSEILVVGVEPAVTSGSAGARGRGTKPPSPA